MTKKRFLLALALMLTAVGGAWAQGHQKYTAAVAMTSLQVGDTLAEGFSLTGEDGNFIRFDAGRFTSTGGPQIARGAIVSIDANCVITASGGAYTFTPKDESGNAGNAWLVTSVSSSPGSSFADIYLSGITVAAPTAPLLNWNAATRTGSLTVPAGNVTLTVDYYGQYTLDSVPTAEGWQVKVNGTPATVTPYSPGSALGHVDNINETDQVELVPPAALRETIKAVRLTESVAAPQVQTLTIGHPYGTTIITYTPGESWRQAIQNHAENANAGWDVWGTPEKAWFGESKLYSMTGEVWSLVDPDTAISSSTQYKLDW